MLLSAVTSSHADEYVFSLHLGHNAPPYLVNQRCSLRGTPMLLKSGWILYPSLRSLGDRAAQAAFLHTAFTANPPPLSSRPDAPFFAALFLSRGNPPGLDGAQDGGLALAGVFDGFFGCVQRSL